MANNNGTKIALWVFAVIVFPALYFIGNNVIANERARIAEDKEIRGELVQSKEELNKSLTEIKVILAELKSDIKYLKQK